MSIKTQKTLKHEIVEQQKASSLDSPALIELTDDDLEQVSGAHYYGCGYYRKKFYRHHFFKKYKWGYWGW